MKKIGTIEINHTKVDYVRVQEQDRVYISWHDLIENRYKCQFVCGEDMEIKDLYAIFKNEVTNLGRYKVIFDELADMECFDTAERVNDDYMGDKIVVWADNGYISEKEATVLQRMYGRTK